MNQTTPGAATITLSMPLRIAHMRVCQAVARIYDEYMADAGQYVSKDLRDDGANPYGAFRTATGIILVFESNVPSRLWTPWGSWHFASSCVVIRSKPEFLFLNDLTLVERTPPWPAMTRSNRLYDLLAVDGEEVPSDPVLLIGHPSDKEARALRQEWKELYRSC